MNLEEIEEELAKHELDIVERLVAEVKRLRWAKWELTNNYAELQTEVKRLREELELEHDQGESFLVQIKELQAENERLKADLDGFIHGGL